MFTLEIYKLGVFRKPERHRQFKSYTSALNYMKKIFDYKHNFVIRDSLNRVLANGHYEIKGDYFLITEKNNIGIITQQTMIF